MSERVLARPPSLVSRYRRTASLPEEYRFSANIKLLISLNKVVTIVMNVVFAFDRFVHSKIDGKIVNVTEYLV
jgi:hypothetical protein